MYETQFFFVLFFSLIFHRVKPLTPIFPYPGVQSIHLPSYSITAGYLTRPTPPASNKCSSRLHSRSHQIQKMSKPVTVNDTSASTTSGQADDTRVCPEIRQGGKLLIRINEPDRKHVFICPEIFRGNLQVNLREYFVDNSLLTSSDDTEIEDQEEQTPYFTATTRGVSLTETEFNNVIKCGMRVQTMIKRLKKKQTKAEFNKNFKKKPTTSGGESSADRQTSGH